VAGRSLDWYDYGARFYEPEIGRFLVADPLGLKFSWQSPYVYANNNPIKLTDYNGESGQVPDSPITTAFNQNTLTKFNQVEKLQRQLVVKILTTQGIALNDKKIATAGKMLEITGYFKNVTVMDFTDNKKTEPKLFAAQIKLKIPGEMLDNDNVKKLLEKVTGDMEKDGVKKILEIGFGIVINAKAANFIEFMFDPVESGKSSLTDQQESAENWEKQEVMNAVINYYLNLYNEQNKKKKDEKKKDEKKKDEKKKDEKKKDE